MGSPLEGGTLRRSAPLTEEGAEQVAALLRQHAAQHLRAGVAGRLLEEAGAVQDGAALRILRAEDEAADAGVADRARAHGAGLERHEEAEAGEAIVAELLRGAADRLNL